MADNELAGIGSNGVTFFSVGKGTVGVGTMGSAGGGGPGGSGGMVSGGGAGLGDRSMISYRVSL